MQRIIGLFNPAEDSSEVEFENWHSLKWSAVPFVGPTTIWLALYNPTLAVIAQNIFCPLFFFARPLREKKLRTLVAFMMLIGTLVAVGQFVLWVGEINQMTLLDMFRNLFVAQNCHGSDPFKLLILYIFPTLDVIKDILLFNGVQKQK